MEIEGKKEIKGKKESDIAKQRFIYHAYLPGMERLSRRFKLQPESHCLVAESSHTRLPNGAATIHALMYASKTFF
jgi:hypothetical protein